LSVYKILKEAIKAHNNATKTAVNIAMINFMNVEL
jgi:hypothetical protein